MISQEIKLFTNKEWENRAHRTQVRIIFLSFQLLLHHFMPKIKGSLKNTYIWKISKEQRNQLGESPTSRIWETTEHHNDFG